MSDGQWLTDEQERLVHEEALTLAKIVGSFGADYKAVAVVVVIDSDGHIFHHHETTCRADTEDLLNYAIGLSGATHTFLLPYDDDKEVP